MKDQYDNPIPEDLCLLEAMPSDMSKEEIKGIENLNWYCFEGNSPYIFVSYADADKISGLIGSLLADSSSPSCISPTKNLLLIDNVLKRWNEIDGFYHA